MKSNFTYSAPPVEVELTAVEHTTAGDKLPKITFDTAEFDSIALADELTDYSVLVAGKIPVDPPMCSG